MVSSTVRRLPPALALFFCAIAFLETCGSNSVPRTGVVLRVVDGDTIVVSGVGTVRLIGVDTPESVHPRMAVEEFSREAVAFTRQLAQNVNVELEFDWPLKDRYGRTLAYVFLPDGRMLNAELIGQGYGHAYTQRPFKYIERFRRLEREARENRRGLWGTVKTKVPQ